MIHFVREKVNLGFWKVGVRIFGYGIRIHIWTKPTIDLTPHDHAWSFISIPLWGTFHEMRWDVRRSSLGYRRFLYSCAAGPGAPLQETDIFDLLAVRRDHVRRPLAPYRCPLYAVHSFWPGGHGFHLSLVLAGRRKLDYTRVWNFP